MRFSIALVAALASAFSLVSAASVQDRYWVVASSSSLTFGSALTWETWYNRLVLQEGLDLRAGWGDSLLLVIPRSDFTKFHQYGLLVTPLKQYSPEDEGKLRYFSYQDNEDAPMLSYGEDTDPEVLYRGSAGAWLMLPSDDSSSLSNQGFDLRPVASDTVVLVDEERVRETLPTPKYYKSVDRVLSHISKDRIYQNVDDLSNKFFTRSAVSQGALDAQAYLENRYGSLPHLKVSTFPFKENYSSNVYAFLPGIRNSTRVVIVGAHYDSRASSSTDPSLRAPGADDNGSGSAAILELATVLAHTVKPPFRGFEYSILFMAFSGEEQGLYGSKAAADEIRASNKLDVIAMFNTDMLGYHPPGRESVLGMKDRSISTTLLEWSMNVTNLYVPGLEVLPSSSCCSDYLSFYEAGFPSIGYFENDLTASAYPNYHKTTDTIENVDFDQVERDLHAVGAAVMLAARPFGLGFTH